MKRVLLLIFAIFCCLFIFSQQLAVKSNMLSDATLAPSLGVEVLISHNVTIDMSGSYSFISPSEKRWKYWIAQPELRFWRCQAFGGFFGGVHLIAGQYNVGGIHLPWGLYKDIREYRYQGYTFGGGISYGYQWVLSPRWSIEAEFGAGYVYVDYTKFHCTHCGEKVSSGHKHYMGPTKAAISLIYFLK